MASITVKGHTIPDFRFKDSFTRRAVKLQNDILTSLRKIGLTEDDVDITLERMPIKNAPASVTWYFEGERLYFSHDSRGRFIDNLYVVAKIIDIEVELLLNEAITFTEFRDHFVEEKDVEKHRIEARELLGVDKDEKDLDVINKKYRFLSKTHHPDMPEGDIDAFKALNRAHKLLKRELT